MLPPQPRTLYIPSSALQSPWSSTDPPSSSLVIAQLHCRPGDNDVGGSQRPDRGPSMMTLCFLADLGSREWSSILSIMAQDGRVLWVHWSQFRTAQSSHQWQWASLKFCLGRTINLFEFWEVLHGASSFVPIYIRRNKQIRSQYSYIPLLFFNKESRSQQIRQCKEMGNNGSIHYHWYRTFTAKRQ